MRIVLATNNTHKKRELTDILGDYQVVTPEELGIEFEFEETGATFQENALGKAFALLELLDNADAGNQDVIVADDSGICVNALSGGPGIYSARYGSPDGGKTELPADARNRLLLDSIADATDRRAHFVCCMVAVWDRDRYAIAQETWPGEIATEPSDAKGGFGYDPVFLVPTHGCTAAQLGVAEKNRLSHRGRAARVLSAALRAAADLP